MPICPPVLRWSASDLASETFKEAHYAILKKHVQVEQRNCQLRSIRHLRYIKWKTNEAPEDAGFMTMGQKDESSILKAFREHDTLFLTFVSDCADLNDPKSLEALLVLRNHMRERGFDPDPNGICEASQELLRHRANPSTGKIVTRVGVTSPPAQDGPSANPSPVTSPTNKPSV